MPEVFNVGFRRGRHEYQLALSWDDRAFAEGAFSFEIEARHRTEDGEWRRVTVTTEITEDKILVVRGGEFEREFPLDELFDESEVLEAIPAALFSGGDPFTGCLLRAGLSTTIAQTIQCKNATAEVPWFKSRARAIGSCFRQHLPKMGVKMSARAARCIFRAGF